MPFMMRRFFRINNSLSNSSPPYLPSYSAKKIWQIKAVSALVTKIRGSTESSSMLKYRMLMLLIEKPSNIQVNLSVELLNINPSYTKKPSMISHLIRENFQQPTKIDKNSNQNGTKSLTGQNYRSEVPLIKRVRVKKSRLRSSTARSTLKFIAAITALRKEPYTGFINEVANHIVSMGADDRLNLRDLKYSMNKYILFEPNPSQCESLNWVETLRNRMYFISDKRGREVARIQN
ncbi:hypothetical protein G9A89_001882 [Geosiphon pyriformis]|nr:hypothetical protein G9A89_001882 [Geosiphon pyriformis]